MLYKKERSILLVSLRFLCGFYCISRLNICLLIKCMFACWRFPTYAMTVFFPSAFPETKCQNKTFIPNKYLLVLNCRGRVSNLINETEDSCHIDKNFATKFFYFFASHSCLRVLVKNACEKTHCIIKFMSNLVQFVV